MAGVDRASCAAIPAPATGKARTRAYGTGTVHLGALGDAPQVSREASSLSEPGGLIWVLKIELTQYRTVALPDVLCMM